jgi:hypothetical protein
VTGPGLGLEENAIKAIRGWRLQPSRDRNGTPVSARTEVEVTLRLIRLPETQLGAHLPLLRGDSRFGNTFRRESGFTP